MHVPRHGACSFGVWTCDDLIWCGSPHRGDVTTYWCYCSWVRLVSSSVRRRRGYCPADVYSGVKNFKCGEFIYFFSNYFHKIGVVNLLRSNLFFRLEFYLFRIYSCAVNDCDVVGTFKAGFDSRSKKNWKFLTVLLPQDKGLPWGNC